MNTSHPAAGFLPDVAWLQEGQPVQTPQQGLRVVLRDRPTTNAEAACDNAPAAWTSWAFH